MYFYITVRDRTTYSSHDGATLCNLTCIIHNIVALIID